eukprot:m.49454 g.49454  ORF g.49454 m.49454 type:complete len:572 (-) comp12077_c0_seq2:117-1832(-)
MSKPPPVFPLYVGEDLLGQYPAKFSKQQGTLFMTNRRVVFVNQQGEVNKSVRIPKISKQRASPPDKPKVRLQLVLVDEHEDKPLFLFTAENGLAQQLEMKETLQQLLHEAKTNPSMFALTSLVGHHNKSEAAGAAAAAAAKPKTLADYKAELLHDRPSLFQSYKELVATQLLSPEEFWASPGPAELLQGCMEKVAFEEQKVGVSSGVLTHMRPKEQEGHATVEYNLTLDTVAGIFRLYPGLKPRYEQDVPHRISEQQFWENVIQSHLFHRGAGGAAGNRAEELIALLEAPPQDTAAAEAPAQDDQDGSAASAGSKRKAHAIVDLTADQDLKEDGYGIESDLVTQDLPKVGRQRLEAMDGVNKESERILRVTSDKTTGDDDAAILHESVLMEDLQQPENKPLPVLALERQTYLKGLSKAAAGGSGFDATSAVDPDEPPPAGYHVHSGPPPALMQAGVATSCLETLSLDVLRLPDPPVAVSSKYATLILKYEDRISVILRHFWSCFKPRPPTSKALKAKARKMGDCLATMKAEKLPELRQGLPSDLASCVDVLERRVDLALAKRDNWLRRMKR